MSIKQFPFRVILSSTTGRLLTEPKGDRNNGIGDLYELLNHITGDNLYTHQLPRANDFCKPFLLSLFPDFEKANNWLYVLDDELNKSGDAHATINAFLDLAAANCNVEPDAMFSVPSLPPDSNWVTMDPVEELQKMIPDKDIIVIEPEEE